MSRFAPIARRLLVAAFLTALPLAPATADVEADKAAIAAQLTSWAAAFNVRDAAGACAIFSADLVSTMRGRPDEGRSAVCRRIASALVDRGMTMRYAPDVKEIIVSGDLAVVRLVWSVTIQRGASPAVSKEPGLDVFRREPDGQWRIIRFLAFSNAPD
jgi:steroid delta-isomerase